MLYKVQSPFSTVNSANSEFTVQILYRNFYSALCTVYSAHCTLYSILYKVYSEYWTHITVESTAICVQYSVYSTQCTVNSVHPTKVCSSKESSEAAGIHMQGTDKILGIC